MIDLTLPGAISFARAAELLPRDSKGRRVGHRTMVRWATRGACGAVLESVRLGKTWYTTRAAILAFAEASARPACPARSAGRASELAEAECRELEAMGI